ncbi:hypothetical protein LC040_12295 [Bacillus tianshenii]|nr:hypothetical protein LC040_12295 [Bacillus tianshenii]
MKEIKLIKLSLRDFKGITHFVLDAEGQNVRIFGDNATGKTTLFDGFVWLLFDKDSHNQKQFQIKRVDQRGKELSGLEHEVEGVFSINGQMVSLRKVYYEKWTKKRGSAIKKFSGHTTDYYIDGVPAKKKEFADKVSQIIDEEIFKLLTNPAYFNEQLHWQKRREILLEICGDITDEEVIASDSSLRKLPSILNGRSIDDQRKVIAARRAEINKELERIPVRIGEVRRSIPEVAGLNEQQIEQQIISLQSKREAKEQELNRIRSGGQVSELEKKLREIQSELMELKNQERESNYGKIDQKRQLLYQTQSRLDGINTDIVRCENQIRLNQESIHNREVEANKLREQWHKVNAETHEFHHDENCPTCGQALPEEQIEEAHKKAQAEFNRKKAERLERIKQQGLAANSVISDLNQSIETYQAQTEDLKKKAAVVQQGLTKVKSDIETLQSNTTEITENPAYNQKLQETEAVRHEIQELKASTYEAENKVHQEIRQLVNEINMIEQDKAKFAQIRLCERRIAELESQEQTLAQEFEQLEEQLYLTEQFIRQKVNLLEEKINSKFKYARFKLFDTQINDGLKETCETLYEGVPYSGGLNNAARINIGLDIINTLSEHYGFQAPIFVDNSEAVTRLIDTDAQVISLVVSEPDKELRIEVLPEHMREAI